MKIAIDISPLSTGHYLQHRVRGTGFYLESLKEALLKYHPENDYIFFKRGENLPKEIDLIHYPYFEPYFVSLPILKTTKHVVTVHDLIPLVFKDKFPPGLKGKIKWEIQKKSLKRCDAIITDSFSSKKDIVKFAGLDKGKISVVYLAAAPYFKNKKSSNMKGLRKKYGLPNNFLLYVGDATWNKNLSSLIKAVNKTPFYLVIAGQAFKNKEINKNNPWNQDLYEAQVLSEKNEKIIALGFVPNEDLAHLYNMATAFIMPSFYEGFGLPVLEAMQSECPVITTREGSLEEIADNATYFVDPYSIDSIKKGIEEVMSNITLRAALSKKGISWAEKFSWKKTANETVAVYEKVFNQNTKR